ncbi:hypothetical protein BDV39DRAFT_28361 [Aspergillus sergii]|uniref:Uncharacterized protein n=1 Tax=Aspergillus sergii TaxID=1034303 RepID=A0A5N6XBC3_9EURO|nr:hypothetical protein BDV39DRAFT_28361 [Aspergillus sergii]
MAMIKLQVGAGVVLVMHAFCSNLRIHRNCSWRTFKTMKNEGRPQVWWWEPDGFITHNHSRSANISPLVGCVSCELFQARTRMDHNALSDCLLTRVLHANLVAEGHCMKPSATMGLWSCRSMRLLQSTFSYIRSGVQCTNTMSSLESIVLQPSLRSTDRRTAKEKALVQPCQPICKTCRHSRFSNHSDNSASTRRASCDKRYTFARLPCCNVNIRSLNRDQGNLTITRVFPKNLEVDPLSSILGSPQFSCP